MKSQFDKATSFFKSELFHDVQMARIFSDSKTFADATPLSPLPILLEEYKKAKTQKSFSLGAFIQKHFQLPKEAGPLLADSSKRKTLSNYISAQWTLLKRDADPAVSDLSLLSLHKPYLVPGGRFREIYYWDSYFTSLGLIDSEYDYLVVDMIDNFLQLQDDTGIIPNGNRTYYVGRSQPPVLALMASLVLNKKTLLNQKNAESFRHRIKLGLEKEYRFWMSGSEQTTQDYEANRRVVRLPNDVFLNRFYDDHAGPRPESYFEDIECTKGLSDAEGDSFYLNLRAACESGWDFSSRWLQKSGDILSLQTTNLLPIDLNCLLYQTEVALSELNQESGNHDEAAHYQFLSDRRKKAIRQYCWSPSLGVFSDYDWVNRNVSKHLHAACFLPLFVNIATEKEAESTLIGTKALRCEFGILTSTLQSKEQWDAPNGWAPLQWFGYQGLVNYGFDKEAKQVATGWCQAVSQYFDVNGVVMEKYNLSDPLIGASGGEYEVQHGFGWTNGVTMALTKALEISTSG